jgi:hypothetical protein
MWIFSNHVGNLLDLKGLGYDDGAGVTWIYIIENRPILSETVQRKPLTLCISTDTFSFLAGLASGTLLVNEKSERRRASREKTGEERK